MNGGNTLHYINLERGTREDDPISAYLLALVLKTLVYSYEIQ